MNTFALVIQREKVKKGNRTSVQWREEIQVDGQRCGQNYCLDYYELVRSLSADGDYFIFTCGCGEAGCAGISEGIRIRYAAGVVEWHVVEPAPEQRFRFAEQQYAQAIHAGLSAATKALPSKGTFPLGYTFFSRTQFKQCVETAQIACERIEFAGAFGRD